MNIQQLILKRLEYLEKLGFTQIPRIEPSLLSPKGAELQKLREEIGDCQRCALSKMRNKIVFGEGNIDPPIMFIGEAPGEEEDRQGRPFVGDAGQLLTRLIEKMGFKREELYIANVVKCRPPQNKEPFENEINTCLPFLLRQIHIINPHVIITLGKVATHALLRKKEPITQLRGKTFYFRHIPVVPTFHPAYLLRNPKDKKLTWQDAKTALHILKKRNPRKTKNFLR